MGSRATTSRGEDSLLTPRTFLAAALLTFLLPAAAGGFPIREIHQPTPDNPPFSRNVYGCMTCTLEEFLAVTPPPGFLRQSAKESAPSSAVLGPVPDAPGVPTSILVDGLEFELFAQLQTAQILDFATQTVIADVERDTLFTYDAGSVLHELMDPDGDTWLLFSVAVEGEIPSVGANPDIGQLDALSGLPIPAGWSYSSRGISEDLVVDSQGLAKVFNVGAQISFQRLAPIPEPGTALLLGGGLAGLATRRRSLGR